MNALNVVSKYADQISAIAVTMLANSTANATAKEAADGRADSLTEQVREFATLTANDGVSVEDGRKGLQMGLTGLEVPKGSVKASGNHYAGFRKLLADGEDISAKSNADAQRAIESREVTEIREAKKAFAKLTKKWKAADWRELVALYTPAAEQPADVTGEEAEEIAQEAAAA